MNSLSTNNRILIVSSIIISIATIISLILINFQIAQYYLRLDKKSQMLFGLLEYLNFGYKYYLSIGGLIAIILALSVLLSSRKKVLSILAFLIGVIALILVFVRLWRFMIHV